MLVTLLTLVIAAIFFMSGKVRSDLVAICSLLVLLIFHVLTPEEGLSGFSNSVVIMMIGLFVVGGAIFQTGLAKMIGSKILKLAGNSETRLFLLVMLTTAGIGAFVSNTGTVALMLPIVVSMAMSSGINSSRLLMPLAFASSVGGMMTLIGTPPNLIISDALDKAGYGSLSFFSFLPVGLVCITVGTLLLMPLTKWFLVKKEKKGVEGHRNKSLDQLVKEYRLLNNLFRLSVEKDSAAVGKTIAELNVRHEYGINILEIRRQAAPQHRFLNTVKQFYTPDTVLEESDILYVSGAPEHVERICRDFGLMPLDGHISENTAGTSLDFYDIGIAEVLLMNTSQVVNRTVKEVNFRDKFNVNVLGISRKKKYLLQNLGEEKLHGGDILLVQGDWKDIARLSREEENWVVLGQPMEEAAKVTLDYKAPVAALIMLLMIAVMVFDFIKIEPVTAVMTAAVLMVITGCLRSVEAAYKTINWETVVLFAAMMPMSLALEKTGISEYVSTLLVQKLGEVGPVFLLGGIYFTASLMTMFISNTVTALLMAPIALQSAVQLGVNPVPFLFAVTVASSMCFASPFSTPPNALVMPAGQYSFMDYVKVGLPLQIAMGLVMIAVLPLMFPF
ncbi:MAG: SLC13 family permease [Bacteroidetes bacterium]|uniref:SLC13 family permease n=1 Tax=Candidatus Egerieousia excrementavium TaxID=2840778 RepID=A0A9D9GZ32_9BACT|nr:SLC13 family permease [Candidatus Egerieousia excrementavium]